MANTRKSKSYRQKILEEAGKHHPPPEGTVFDAEQTAIWYEIQSMRSYSDWTAADLLVAVSCVEQEAIIRRGWEQMRRWREDGADPLNPDSIAAEYAENLSKMIRLNITTLRSIGLTRVASATTNKKKNVKEGHEAQDAAKSFDIEGGSLLAVN